MSFNAIKLGERYDCGWKRGILSGSDDSPIFERGATNVDRHEQFGAAIARRSFPFCLKRVHTLQIKTISETA
jgi:hypothetical protein